jgi:hypothetical protein
LCVYNPAEVSIEQPRPPLPIKAEQTALVLGGFKNKMGFLALLPDQIVFLESSVFSGGGIFGGMGALIRANMQDAQSLAKAIERGKAVTALPLAELAVVRHPKGNFVEIESTSGNTYKFGGISYDKWAAVIKAHLESRGASVVSSPTEIRIQT